MKEPRKAFLRRVEYRAAPWDSEWLLKELAENDFNVYVKGPTVGTGHAYFNSKILPRSPVVPEGQLEDVIERCHALGIRMIAWVFFNIENIGDVDQYLPAKLWPDWRMKFINPPEDGKADSVGMCVMSSPFRETWLKFLYEAVDLGFDGFWFDGTRGSGLPNEDRIGCVCPYCAEKFARECGMDLPKAIDWEDAAFRRWVTWRYDKMMETADFYTTELKKKRADLEIIFSSANRPGPPPGWELSWGYAWPIRRYHSFGSSEHSGLMYTNGVQLVDYHSRLARAQNAELADIWNPMAGTVTDHFIPYLPIHRFNMAMHYLGAAAAGVSAWAGLGTTPIRGRMKEINDKLRVVEKFFGGEPLAHCAVHFSQNTRDFYGHRRGMLGQYSEGLFGTYSILAQEHALFNFVLDDYLEEGDFGGAKVLVLPNSACLSDRQLTRIETFAREGGLVIAWFDAGRYDEEGEERAENPLAVLAGVKCSDEVIDAVTAGRRVLKLTSLVLPDELKHVILGGPARPFQMTAENSTVEAVTVDGNSQPAIVSRKLGKGEIIWLEADLGAAYYRTPHLELRQLLALLEQSR